MLSVLVSMTNQPAQPFSEGIAHLRLSCRDYLHSLSLFSLFPSKSA
ncbi:MAG: hypothetical protein LBK82_15195 [Planctomycetaceae bacterium]|nr:hypothetical protein [Planctomycetaceae bacterium]